MIAAYALLFGVISIIKYRYYPLQRHRSRPVRAQALDRLLHGSMFSSIRRHELAGRPLVVRPVPARPDLRGVPPSRHAAARPDSCARLARSPCTASRAARSVRHGGAPLRRDLPRLPRRRDTRTLFEFHPETLCTTTLLFTFDALPRRAGPRGIRVGVRVAARQGRRRAGRADGWPVVGVRPQAAPAASRRRWARWRSPRWW